MTKKISQLPAASSLTGVELFETVQGGVSKKTTAQDIAGTGSLVSLAVPISSSQILNCFDTPIEVIPTPGAGKFIALVSTAWQIIAGSTGYQFTSACELYFTSSFTNGKGISDVHPNSALAGTESLILQSTAAAGSVQPGINASVVFGNPEINPTDGDGSLVVYVDYLIKTVL